MKRFLALIITSFLGATSALGSSIAVKEDETLSEANRVPESTLIPALTTQCHNVGGSVFNQSPPQTSSSGG